MHDYQPSEIEKKWQTYWQMHSAFKTADVGDKKFYCLDFFPFPSHNGLHVGELLGFIATDILCRYKRMLGYTVLHPMGWDAFGLPTEQHAIRSGEHPSVVTENNCREYRSQLQALGLSYDWDRELTTSHPDYYGWTQWIFLKLYNSWFDDKLQKTRPIDELPLPRGLKSKGRKALEDYKANYRLAYYADAMVNWCPALGTVVANEEVIDGHSRRGSHPIIRKPMKQWHLRITKYAERLLKDLEQIDWPENIKEQQRNWIGKKSGVEIYFKVVNHDCSIKVFTDRPDTLFGATFCAISTEHPLINQLVIAEYREKLEEYCHEARNMSDLSRTIENRKKTGVFTGSFVVNPITEEQLPLYVGDYVLMSCGSGAIMGVPAHDERDFDFARMYQLDIRPVILPEEESGEVVIAVAEGEMPWIGPGRMVPSKAKIYRELGLEGRTNQLAGERIVKWLEEWGYGRQTTVYNLHDWLFSRQRYWGEPIPVVHWADGTTTALPESELPLELPNLAKYHPHSGGESPLAHAKEWLKVEDPKSGDIGRRETDTMPNWAGSCWYYLRFIDSKNQEQIVDAGLERAWMPVDLYVGSAEHAVLHLLYARFWHKVLFDLGYTSCSEPFKRLFNQGVLRSFAYRDRKGTLVAADSAEITSEGRIRQRQSGEPLERIEAKMSPALKNTVMPESIIALYGADALRMYEMFIGPLDSSHLWNEKAIAGIDRFLKRVWAFATQGPLQGWLSENCENNTLRKALHQMIKKVGDDIDQLKFNTAISAMMGFLNQAEDEPVSKELVSNFILTLSPFAPHISEELWSRLGNSGCVFQQSWPEFDPSLLQEETVAVVIQVNGRKHSTIETTASISEKNLRKAVSKHLSAQGIKITPALKFIFVYQAGTEIPRLVNIVNDH